MNSRQPERMTNGAKQSALQQGPTMSGLYRLATLLGVGFSSAAVLVLEIVLTRVFAVAQFYHFAFVAVGLALLGFGASGSVLAVVPRLGKGGPRRWALLAAAQSMGTVGAYLVANILPFDSFSIAWDRRQVLYLALYYLALAVPFFFGGVVVGTLLSGWDQPVPVPSHHVYAASLIGAGVGCIVALGGISPLGGVGVVMVSALLAMLAAVTFLLADQATALGSVMPALVLSLILGLWSVAPPGFLDLRLSPYKDLSAVLRYPDAELVATGWNSSARVDLVRSESIRSLPGLSFTYQGVVPTQAGLTFDGDDLSPVPQVAPGSAEFTPYLMSSLPYLLRPNAEALVLEPRGGLGVLVALDQGAARVVAVEPNGLAVAYAQRAGGPYGNLRVQVVEEEPRSFVERSGERFDVIDVTLTAPYRPVTSGAYSLAEAYGLTVEAFVGYLQRLRPGGVLSAMRWLQTPPSEEIRMASLAAEGARQVGADPAASVVVLRGYSTALTLLSPEGFSAGDMAVVRQFADERRFDLVAGPGVGEAEANRYNVVPDDSYYRMASELLSSSERDAMVAAYSFDISPPVDDRPFFSHFFTWGQAGDVWVSLGRTWQPFGGAGYFVLLAFLALAVLAAVFLILAPLALRRRDPAGRGEARLRGWTVAYFGLLGVGFLFVEIPIVQRYILLVGRPTTSLGVVLFALLVSSGIGSRYSRRIPWRPGAWVLVALLAVYPWMLRGITALLLETTLAVRMTAGALALAPAGFLMGTMFPRGLGWLEGRSEQSVPWAWGINGAASVVSAAAAAVMALSFGFTVVMVAGAVSYGLAALLAKGDPKATSRSRPV